jgi:ABC-2 type transport system permease protein
MRPLRGLVRAEGAAFLRDKVALFFTFLFPLIFILIFGFLMGDVDQPSAALGVYVAPTASDADLRPVLEASGVHAISEFADVASLTSAVTDRDVDFGLVWAGQDLDFLYHPNRVQENYAFEQIALGITNAFNLRRQGLEPILPVVSVNVGNEASSRWFNRMVPGILAFSILTSGLFAVSGHLTAMKERRTLDRMLVTPMPPVALLVAVAAVRLVVIYVSTLMTLLVSVALFDLNFSIDWLSYTLLVACSTLGMMGLGTVIALIVRKPSSAGNVANVLAMVMMFLSGIYFPIELMPPFLRALSKGLPLTYLADAMRFATGVQDMSIVRFWAIVASFLGIALVLFPVLAGYVVRPQRT